MAKIFLFLGSIFSLLAVLIGAFGAHALEKKLLQNDKLETFAKASQYHFYHALGLLIVGLLILKMGESSLLKISGYSMISGLILFSGSLYVYSLTLNKIYAMVTPLGELALIVSWALMSTAIYKYL